MRYISLFFFLFSVPMTLSAQKDAKATELLNAVSSNYKSFKTMQATFTIIIENQKEKTTDKQKGTLTVKGDKYKVELGSQDIISDGQIVWTHLKEEKEVQINSNDKSKEDQLTPNRIFSIGQSGFKSRLGDSKKEGSKTIQTVELTPEDAKKPYFKIVLQIDKSKNLLTSLKVLNKSGINITYSIDKFLQNVEAPDVYFSFDTVKHKDVEVIDLR
ncbi:MAG: outer membrane lipoprotein carrier protein LolA [Bacteroidia bacterium]|nr:outer membrane lipoprotein carrier protein LolA [Bacteroidia bacterium]